MTANRHNERYIAGLDGIRAFAVLAVLFYHFGFSWARGGFLGVDIFFVLSGFLITSILLPESGNDLHIQLKSFWMGRIRRLLPASYLMISVTFVYVIFFRQELFHTVKGDAISSFFYTSNWWFIFHELSYFDQIGSISPLKNLWSLAIEEQFYLFWPILMILCFKWFKRRSALAAIVVIGILSSALLMGVMYQPGIDPSRVYYGTDTRCFELLTGCLLAIFLPMKKLSKMSFENRWKRGSINAAGILAFLLFVFSVYAVDEFQDSLYRGVLLLFCVNSALLIACTGYPNSLSGRLLSAKPLRWMGTRSYSIYLWHYPVTVLSTPVYEIGHPVYWRVLVQLFAVFALAELSYHFIEMPIRRLGFKQFFKAIFSKKEITWKRAAIFRIATVCSAITVLILVTGTTGMADSKVPSKEAGSFEEKVIIIDEQEEVPIPAKPINNSDKTTDGGVQTAGSEVIVPAEQDLPNDSPIIPDSTPASGSSTSYEGILAIGDSILIDISTALHERYDNITIDAKIGRQVSQAADFSRKYSSFNRSDKAVIIELGTNGYFTEDQIKRLLDSFSESTIYLVNTRVPRPWEFKVNEAFNKKAAERENVILVDWYSAAISHPEYFSPDGVHLMPEGVEALTNLIVQTVK